MYNSQFPRAAAEPQQMTPLFQFPPPQVIVVPELDQLCCSSPSGCSSYGEPPYLMQRRSVSSHSLPRNSSFHPLISPVSGPFRRVSSTGDLQRAKGGVHYQRSESSPSSNENSIIFESMNRATKYSPEEKKERIDRYRNKRHQRNFNKKIKYACRKTLADSRPRIRGRFARNDEIETNPQSQYWRNINGGDEDEGFDENWIHFLEAFSTSLLP